MRRKERHCCMFRMVMYVFESKGMEMIIWRVYKEVFIGVEVGDWCAFKVVMVMTLV